MRPNPEFIVQTENWPLPGDARFRPMQELVHPYRNPQTAERLAHRVGCTEVERVLRQFPEVVSVVTKLGRPDVATEAMGIYQGDVYVLKPRTEWPRRKTKDELIEAISAELAKVPGVTYNITQPVAMRLDEVVSGVKADVAVKIFGEDERMLDQKADEVLRLLSGVRGAADAQKEVFAGAAEWQIDLNRTRPLWP